MPDGQRLGPGEPRSAGSIPQRRVPQAWPKDRRFRILSIDGGGIRGIFPAAVLAGLERRYTGGSSIAACFDLIAGTSTGGILALGLGASFTAAQLLELYVTRGCEVFPQFADNKYGRLRTWVRNQRQYMRYRYDREALQRKVGTMVDRSPGNYGWADVSFSDGEFRLGTGEHFYDQEVGGDTESRTVFQAHVGANSAKGSVSDWLETAQVIAASGEIDVEDETEYDAIDWTGDTERDELGNLEPPP